MRRNEGTLKGVDGQIKEDISAAVSVVQKYQPKISDELAQEYARKALLVARALRENQDQAKLLFGKDIVADMQSVSRQVGMQPSKGNAGYVGKANTLDPHMQADLNKEVASLSTTSYGY